jgi:LmbE family N-acetylglucosaminyl deacetylase
MPTSQPERSENWQSAQKILVILAHPDDPEFFCGATLARWARLGHAIHYLLLTCGDKGAGPGVDPQELCARRQVEQRNAAAVIGAGPVQFLQHEDGYLVPDLALRREVVRAIRRERPDVLLTCDPTLLYTPHGTLNHPDHRAAGQVVLDAVFPAAGNAHYFPELLSQEGLEPHTPREVWVSLAVNPTHLLEVSDTWEVKLAALKEHVSQIEDPARLEQRLRARHTEDSTDEHPRYEERFRVIKYG